MENEIWNDVPGYEGLYQASNLGGVRSLDHTARGGHGALIQRIKGRVLKQREHGIYLTVSFSVNGKERDYYVHRAVWEAFNGPIPEGLVINHVDENPRNNRLDNLMVCTQAENLNWGTHNEKVRKALKERAKIINPIIHLIKNYDTNKRAI